MLRVLPIFAVPCLVGLVLVASPALADEAADLRQQISIEFPKDGYVFTRDAVAKGVEFNYSIVVARDISGLTALAHSPSCAEPAGPSGLHPRQAISGDGQLYCLMDYGLAPPCMGEAQLLKQGTYKHKFAWDGRNWTGPSDFGNPKGAPFPAGTYDVTVTVRGTIATDDGAKPYEIKAQTKLVLK